MKKSMLSTKQSYALCAIGVLVLFGILVAVCETGAISLYVKGILMTCCIAVIMTTSLNLTIGVLGQLTLGCCGFEAIGAYSAALMSKLLVANGVQMDDTVRFLLVTFVGGVVACVFGVLVGIPALRLHGDYLAIITLGFGEIIRVIIQNLKVAGGKGLADGQQGQALIGIDRLANLYVVFCITVVTVVLLFMFARSRYGRAVKAIRDDEIAAGASGINITYESARFCDFRVLRGYCGWYFRAIYRCAHAKHGRLAAVDQLRDHGGVRRYGFADGFHCRRGWSDDFAGIAACVLRIPHARVFGGAGDHHGVPSAGIVRQLGVLAAEIRQHVVLSGTREDARQIGCVSIGI